MATAGHLGREVEHLHRTMNIHKGSRGSQEVLGKGHPSKSWHRCRAKTPQTAGVKESLTDLNSFRPTQPQPMHQPPPSQMNGPSILHQSGMYLPCSRAAKTQLEPQPALANADSFKGHSFPVQTVIASPTLKACLKCNPCSRLVGHLLRNSNNHLRVCNTTPSKLPAIHCPH